MHFQRVFNRFAVITVRNQIKVDRVLSRKFRMDQHFRSLGILTRDDFILPHESPSTFAQDANLPKLPLPKLEETLERYYKNLLPFGSENELANSRKIIEDFKNGCGRKLHAMLEEKASKEKNWIEGYWEDYAYLTSRTPPAPTQAIVQPYMLEAIDGVELNEENRLNNFARVVHYFGQFWELIRNERLRPSTNPDASIIFSSNQYRRLFNTSRIPGEVRDNIKSYFTTAVEHANCPSSNVLILGNGKIFYFDIFRDGKLISPQEILYALTFIDERIKGDPGDEIAILTCDDRTSWAENRKYLMELSIRNAQFMEIVESSMMAFSFDNNEPKSLGDVCEKSLDGNYSARWMDKSINPVFFKNGKIGCIGEHTCYDGPVFVGVANFILASFNEDKKPDWTENPKTKIFPSEIKFHVDKKVKNEVRKVKELTEGFRGSVHMKYEKFAGFGKKLMKQQKVHPDCYVQMALQLAYFKIHKKLAPTYESATMRAFYHGRTETARSCSIEVKDWIEKVYEGGISASEKAKLFREAANAQFQLMKSARSGKGFDRHLFGLWCAAYENKMPIPAFYDDPLYAKSGGGGNFVLSTSTLGYAISNGGMAPMMLDGYGTFYTMLDDCIWILVTSFRDSKVASCETFYTSFECAMNEIKKFLKASSSKL